MSESSPENTSAEAGAQDVNLSAESSAAEAEGVSWLDRVESALTASQEESPTSEEHGSDEQKSDPAQSKEGAEEEETESEEDEVSEEELKKYTQGAQQRIRQLIGQKKGIETELSEHRQQLETLRPKAEHLDKITGWMNQHGIEPQEFDNTLAITGLIKSGKYDEALKAVEPIYQQLKELSGDVLPAELQEQVRLGYITEAHARQLHKSQTTLTNQQRLEAERQQRDAGEREQRAFEERITSAARAADEWAKEKAGSDPDWHQKQDRVAKELKLILYERGAEKYPRNREEARAVAEEALKNVEADLKQFRPPLKPLRAPTGQFASPRSQAKPSTYMEAVEQALAPGG